MKVLVFIGAVLAAAYVVTVFGMVTVGSNLYHTDDVHFYE